MEERTRAGWGNQGLGSDGLSWDGLVWLHLIRKEKGQKTVETW